MGLAFDDYVSTGEVGAAPLEVQTGKNHLGARRADIDTDRRQLNVVTQPYRILFQRSGIDVVMVVIGIGPVVVRTPVTRGMIGNRVAGLLRFIGHAQRCSSMWIIGPLTAP